MGMRWRLVVVGLLAFASGSLTLVACGGDDAARAREGELPDARTEAAALPVDGGARFELAVSAKSVTVVEGESATVTVDVVPIGAFSETVILAATGAPVGVATNADGLAIASATPRAAVVISAAAKTRHGTTRVTIRGKAGPLEAAVSVDVLVRGPPGSLDTSFGDAGVVVTPLLLGDANVNALLLTSDDRVVVAGGAR